MKLTLFSILFLCTQCFAETKLSWSKAIELLQQNNAELILAEKTFKATAALEDNAASGYLPSVSASMGYTQTKTSSPDDNSTVFAGTLSLSQNLFAGFKDNYKLSQARANTKIAFATFQTAKAKISYDLVNAYQGMISAQESLTLAKNIVRRRSDDLRLVELRFEGGRENKGSVLLSQAYLAEAKYENTLAEHALIAAQTTLANMLGIKPQTTFTLVEQIPTLAIPGQPDFEILAKQTPSYVEALATMDSNVAAIGVARSSFFPSLNLSANLGKSAADFFPKSDKWSVAATLTIPIYDGYRDYSSLENAKYTKDASVAKNDLIMNQNIESIQLAHQKLIEAIEKQNVDKSFEAAALVRAEIARSQYNNGLISFTDWDNIEGDLINRQKVYLQSKKDRVLIEANWKKTIGDGVL